MNHDEKIIERAFGKFSQMQVDTAHIERMVKLNMRQSKPHRKVGVFMAASIAIMVLMAGAAYAAAGFGLFDRFIAQHDPGLAEVLLPVEHGVTVDGIRTNVIAAQMFGNQGIVYMTLRDVSGQNRITQDSQFVLNGPDMFGMAEMIYFDELLGKAYFELEITTASPQDYLDLGPVDIFFNQSSNFTQPLEMQLQVNPTTIPVGDFHNLPHGIMLAPALAGQFAELPYSNGNIWISGMAIIEDYLHIQIGEHFGGGIRWNTRLGSPVLTKPCGAVSRTPVYENGFYVGSQIADWAQRHNWVHTCENLQPIDIFDGEITANYVFREYAFPVNVEMLEQYSLEFAGVHVAAGTEMYLGLRVDAGDSAMIRMVNQHVELQNAAINSITISPVGVRFTGEMNADVGVGEHPFFTRLFNIGYVALETADGYISLGNAITMIDMYPSLAFSSMARAASPIDAEAVVAVIVDGVRVEF